jgi:hypothetical protein
MLPSEKSEKWVRRLACAALIFVILYLLIWLLRFIVPIFGRVLRQRQPPPEARVWETDYFFGSPRRGSPTDGISLRLTGVG